jgi:hypothetical protein
MVTGISGLLLACLLVSTCHVSRSQGAGSDVAIVTTPQELVKAVNVAGVRHVIIQRHMNVSMAVSDLAEPLLRLSSSTKSIYVRAPAGGVHASPPPS